VTWSGRALHRDDAAVHPRAPRIWNEDIGCDQGVARFTAARMTSVRRFRIRGFRAADDVWLVGILEVPPETRREDVSLELSYYAPTF